MFKTAMLKAAALAVVASSFAVAVPADAKRHGKYRQYQNSRTYDNGYNNPYRSRNRTSYYRGCDKGNGGLAVGAIAGGLAGHEIAGRGDRTLGTIIGAGVGAIAGRAIDKSNDPCRR